MSHKQKKKPLVVRIEKKNIHSNERKIKYNIITIESIEIGWDVEVLHAIQRCIERMNMVLLIFWYAFYLWTQILMKITRSDCAMHGKHNIWQCSMLAYGNAL